MMNRIIFSAFLTCGLAVGADLAAAAEACADGDGYSRTAFRGAIEHPDDFVHPFGAGYRFELVPIEQGWDIAVFDSDGGAMNVIVPASGIPRENPRALLGRHFPAQTGLPLQRHFAFGEDATNPLLHPELTIVPGAAGGAPAPSFGRGSLEVLGTRTDTDPGSDALRLAFLAFEACVEWMPIANETTNETANEIGEEHGPPPEVDFPGFDPVERIFEEAMIQFHSIADQLRLAERGEIDGETALERIEALREILRDVRQRWRETDVEQRREARTRLLRDFEQAERRVIEGIDGYARNGDVDYRILQTLREPPSIGDFLREPPIETFQGIFRSGFEVSDFYLFDGEGPWWLESTNEVWQELQSFMVQRPGRGSSVTVALSVTGWRESEGGYGSVEQYETRIYVESIESIRQITEDEYWTAVGITRQ